MNLSKKKFYFINFFLLSYFIDPINLQRLLPIQRDDDVILSKSETPFIKPLVSIQARIQNDAPLWDEDLNEYVSIFGPRAAMDSVNLASVEGVLMYLQAECINKPTLAPSCQRKNNVKYIVFYEVQIVPSYTALEYFKEQDTPEYGPYVAMDSGLCTPLYDMKLTKECLHFFGGESSTYIGPYVGAASRETDFRAPYVWNYWFSYPGSCVMKKWYEKDPFCRSFFSGGQCLVNQIPDGKHCIYQYKILGYMDIDELTGIYELIDSRTNQTYNTYEEFCTDINGTYGGIEYLAHDSDKGWTYNQSIPFWEDPFNTTRNHERVKIMIHKYHQIVEKNYPFMKPLKSVEELIQRNPSCEKNSLRCRNASYGCSRLYYSQLCRLNHKAIEQVDSPPHRDEIFEKNQTKENLSINETYPDTKDSEQQLPVNTTIDEDIAEGRLRIGSTRKSRLDFIWKMIYLWFRQLFK